MDNIEALEEELRESLDWKDVRWVDDSFVIRCKVYDLRNSIRNVYRMPGAGWFVRESKFRILPISFLVEIPSYENYSGGVNQTWTWKGGLHRAHDKPAVVNWDSSKCILNKAWYKHGKSYREHGQPVKERYMGYRINEIEGYPDLYSETWKSADHWWTPEQIYCPTVARTTNGMTIRKRDTHVLHSPEDDISARIIETTFSRFGSSFDIQRFPYSIQTEDFEEIYLNGTIVSRCFALKMCSVYSSDDGIETDNPKDTFATNELKEIKARKNMIDSPELYNPLGKFFENETAEFFWATEVL